MILRGCVRAGLGTSYLRAQNQPESLSVSTSEAMLREANGGYGPTHQAFNCRCSGWFFAIWSRQCLLLPTMTWFREADKTTVESINYP